MKHSQDNKQTEFLLPASQTGQSSSTEPGGKIPRIINYFDASLKQLFYWLADVACNNYTSPIIKWCKIFVWKNVP